jgi:hypothetical protein
MTTTTHTHLKSSGRLAVNANELVEHIIKTGTRGVWFWGAGSVYAPQDVAKLYAKEAKVPYQYPALHAGSEDTRHNETAVELVEVASRVLGPLYRRGDAIMFTGSPVFPILVEVAKLIGKKDTHHEWYDRIDQRGEKLVIFIDACHRKNSGEVANEMTSTRWAKESGADPKEMASEIDLLLKKFMVVQVSPDLGGNHDHKYEVLSEGNQ